jgi:hypothetical protein
MYSVPCSVEQELYFCTLNYTDKKEKKIFLIYKEIPKGSGAKSYEEGLPII